MNLLNHLAEQYQTLLIPFQETHCTCADKLTIPGFALAGSFLTHWLPRLHICGDMVQSKCATYPEMWIQIFSD